MVETWYRFTDYYVGAPKVALLKFEVVRYTSQGVWLKPATGAMTFYSRDNFPKWVSRFSNKRFAYPTIEEAKVSYIIRKRRQRMYANDTLAASHARQQLVEADSYICV